MTTAPDQIDGSTAHRPPRPGRFSLLQLLLALSVVALACGYVVTLSRLRSAQNELLRLRNELGYLEASGDEEIAAVRMTSDQPMTYRVRVRVPAKPAYRIAYSSLWPELSAQPDWFAAVPVPVGESLVIVRILKDPRDDRWKITTLVRGDLAGESSGTRRMATVLPDEHTTIFRGSHEWLRAGIPRKTTLAPVGQSLRVLDDRALVGPGAQVLYGDRPPEQDTVGVFAELQPDIGPL